MGTASYRPVWIAGLALHLSRWLSLFLATYIMASRDASPILIQAGGALHFLPMLLIGPTINAVSERFGRRNLCVGLSLLLALVTGIFASRLQVNSATNAWLVLFLLLMGFGSLANFSVRLVLVHDVVGDQRANWAMTLEGVSAALATLLGPLVGGYLIGEVGDARSLWLIAICYLISALALTTAKVPRTARHPADLPLSSSFRTAIEVFRSSASLRSVIGVTGIMNLFFFSFIPLIPFMGLNLGVGAMRTGLLGGALGVGSLLGAGVLLVARRTRTGTMYVMGAVVALAALLAFSITSNYVVALVAMTAAGFGQAGFTTGQGILAIRSVEHAQRGTAVVLMGMSIGVLPVGAISIGGLAAMLGAPITLTAASLIGSAALVLWVRMGPEILRMQ